MFDCLKKSCWDYWRDPIWGRLSISKAAERISACAFVSQSSFEQAQIDLQHKSPARQLAGQALLFAEEEGTQPN